MQINCPAAADCSITGLIGIKRERGMAGQYTAIVNTDAGGTCTPHTEG